VCRVQRRCAIERFVRDPKEMSSWKEPNGMVWYGMDVGSLGFRRRRRQFVWMMLNELSPPTLWNLFSPHEWSGTKVNYMHSPGSPVRYYILLYFCYFVSCCAFHRILWISIQFFPLIFPLQFASWRVSWFVHNMICLSLGFYTLGGGVNRLAELNGVLSWRSYIL